MDITTNTTTLEALVQWVLREQIYRSKERILPHVFSYLTFSIIYHCSGLCFPSLLEEQFEYKPD